MSEEFTILHLTWRLPRIANTVSTPRRALQSALTALGVTADCVADLVLALTEACANAVEHAHLAAEYHVTITADRHRCAVEIVDCGVGIADPARVRPSSVAPAAHRGRGIMIMQACTDSLDLAPVDPHGLAVRFTKRLAWEPGSPDRLLAPAG
ncbi:ATP-binding protein [Actinoplanes sp. NPDC049599]|uniref:ATP-binding protein n=1 Tax=Actinoplanes sp. NPDC049599 TaxID=3363903 RepID=UPI0037A3D56D